MAINFETIANFFLGSAVGKLSGNFDKVNDEFDKVVYRDGSKTLTGDLDVNSNRILNLPAPVSGTEPALFNQVGPAIAASSQVAADKLEVRANKLLTDANVITTNTNASITTSKVAEALASANTATDKATIATTQAGIATAQAGISTTKAVESGVARDQAVAAGTAFGASAALVPALLKADTRSPLPTSPTLSYGKRTLGTSAGANITTWILNDSTMAATTDGYRRDFWAFFNTALVGRTAGFAILRPSTGLCVYNTGMMPAEATGLNVFTQASYDAAQVFQPGDIIQATTAATSPNSFAYETTSGFNTIRTSATTLPAVGATYGSGGTAQTNLRPIIGYSTNPTTLFLTTDHLGVANGVPRLDDSAKVLAASLPGYLGKTLAKTDTISTIEGSQRVLRSKNVDQTDALISLKPSSTFAFGNTFANVFTGYVGGAAGASKAGFIDYVIFPKGCQIPAGGTLQLAVVRPRTTPQAALNTSFTGDPVQVLGEYDLSNLIFGGAAGILQEDLRVPTPLRPVAVGDMIVARGPTGFGLVYGTNTGGTHEYDNAFMASGPVLSDLTLSAFDPSATGIVFSNGGTNRLPIFTVHIFDGDWVTAGSGPGALPRLDGNGNLPKTAARPAALPLKNKKILFAGDSYMSGVNAWPALTADMLGCQQVDLAIGGTTIQWNPTTPTNGSVEFQTFGATEAELAARFPGGSGGDPGKWSYQRRALGQGADGWVIGYGINDSNFGSLGGVGAWGDTTPNTYYGAMTRVIEAMQHENPYAGIWLVSVGHPWASYSGTGFPVEQANRAQYAAAAADIVNRLRLRGLIDMFNRVPTSRVAVADGKGLEDSIHWKAAMVPIAARQGYSVMNGSY